MSDDHFLDEVPQAKLVDLLGVSASHFRRLRAAGVFTPIGKGMYDLKTAIVAWVTYHSKASDSTLLDERRKLTIVQRKRIEQEIALRDRELVELVEVERLFLAAITSLIGQLDGVAGRLAFEMAAITDPALCRAVLLREHRRIRESYAHTLETAAATLASSQPPASPTKSDSGAMGGPEPDIATGNSRTRPLEEWPHTLHDADPGSL